MIYTVTVNPCLDEEKYFSQQDLAVGTNRAYKSEKYPGGKGIDVSRAIYAVGSRSTATGFIGGHIGTLVRGMLAIEGIQCNFVEVKDESRTNVICHLNGGKEIRINASGPKVSGDSYQELIDKIRAFSDAEAGLVSGSVCRGLEPLHSYDQILGAFKEGRAGCPTFLDTDESHTMAALDSTFSPDFIKPNIFEFHSLLRLKVNGRGLVPEGGHEATVDEEYLIKRYCSPHPELPSAWALLAKRLQEFASAYPRVRVLLTVSQFGALSWQDGRIWHSFYCGPLERKTTVGAGDSFLGGFVTSFVQLRSGDLGAALKLGVAASAARLQGAHREHGYIDREKLQQVKESKQLYLEAFDADSVESYVRDSLFPRYGVAGAETQVVTREAAA